MITTTSERILQSIYGMVQISLLVFALLTFKPDSAHMNDDLRTIGLMVITCLLALPSSILVAPLLLCLGFLIAFVFSSAAQQFVASERLAVIPEVLFLLFFWFGIFISGYRQWFGYPQKLKDWFSSLEIRG